MKRNRSRLIVLIVAVLAFDLCAGPLVWGQTTPGQSPTTTTPPPAKKKKPTPPPPARTPPKRTNPTPAKPVSTADADERTYWESIKDSKNPADFRAYLETYGEKGKFSDLAHNRLTEIERTDKPTDPKSPATSNVGANSPSVPTRNQYGIDFVWIAPGKFLMGSPPGEVERQSNEGPQHPVSITRGYYLGAYEVTQGQWAAVMGTTLTQQRGNEDPTLTLPVEAGNYPMYYISWDDTQAFIQRLNALNDGFTYRLPTEAEWEFAARAGTTGPFAFGSSLSSTQANFDGDYSYGGAAKGPDLGKSSAVGSYSPNDWGLYDMHGNVAEWCDDIWADYSVTPRDGSANKTPSDSIQHVLRGGSWGNHPVALRSSRRDPYGAGNRNRFVGFRVVRMRKS